MKAAASHVRYLDELLQEFAIESVPSDIKISGIASDSRQVQKDYLFLACQGKMHDRVGFVADAIKQGAIAVAIDKTEANELAIDIPVIAIDDLARNLGNIAAKFFDHPSSLLSLIGITGTNGKTSCSHLLAQCLDMHGQQCGIIGTMGYGFFADLNTLANTTPGPIELQSNLYQLQQNAAQAIAMEVSSHGLQQHRTTGCHFSIAVFTNLSRDHLDYHGTLQAYGASKLKLFQDFALDAAVINLDDPFAIQVVNAVAENVDTIGISLSPEQPIKTDFYINANIVERTLSGTKFTIDSSWGQAEFNTHLLGDFNVHNLLLVLGVMFQQGVPLQRAVQYIAALQAPKGRLESFVKDNQPLVVVDYAHTPDALEKVLQTLHAHTQGELWVLFGCGGDRDIGKRPQMGQVAEKFADHVWLTDDNPRTEASENIIKDILSGINKVEKVIVNPSRETAIREIIAAAAVNDIVLIAGKGHEEYQLIGDQILSFSDREVVAQFLEEAA